MSNDEATSRIQKLLASKRGPELISAIGVELGDLHSQIRRLSNQVRQLQTFHAFSERMSFLAQSHVNPVRLPNSLCIDAAQLFEPENGFHQLEYERNGQPFRWTGPRRDFSFSLYIDRGTNVRVRLEVAYMMDPTRQAELIVLVDGQPFPLKLARETSGWAGEVTIPALPTSQATHLVFVVPCVMRPGTQNDTRTLGIAFRRLAIIPCGEEMAGLEPAAPFGSPQHELLAQAKAFADADEAQGDTKLKLVKARTAALQDQSQAVEKAVPPPATAASS